MEGGWILLGIFVSGAGAFSCWALHMLLAFRGGVFSLLFLVGCCEIL